MSEKWNERKCRRDFSMKIDNLGCFVVMEFWIKMKKWWKNYRVGTTKINLPKYERILGGKRHYVKGKFA